VPEARTTWSDERLDDLSRRREEDFRRIDARFDGLEARFDALQRTILQLGGGMFATLVVGFAGLIATGH
jgi:hypothetical protein